MRLDAYLVKKHPEFSRSVLQKFIKAGRVIVDGKVVLEPKHNVSSKNVVTSNFELPTSNFVDLPIIYEDENVIVINKPAGVLTHSKGALNEEFTVSDFILSRSPSNHITIQPSNRHGIVHRLDRGTSGVIIGAKNEETLKFLQKQFGNRKVKKTYLALVGKTPKQDEFIIDLPIARNPKKPSTFRVDAKGKSAITNVKVIEKFDDGSALLELRPLTGRTHQLRVHLAHIGSPIVGDIVYGKPADRMYLHAKSLETTLPGGERKNFTADTPKEFDK